MSSNEQRHIQFPEMIWWTGVVESREDPLPLGRYKVRIVSLHSADVERQSVDDLMWALPVNPVTSASISGIGVSPTGLVEGALVVGFFADGNKGQQPLILGSIAGNPFWTREERQSIIQDTLWANIDTMFDTDGVERDFTSLPDEVENLRLLLEKRYDFEIPHIRIKPNLAYEDEISVSMPSVAEFSAEEMKLFRHFAAIFTSNINYLCVTKGNRLGKYQFTTDFLNSQGIMSGDDPFAASSWSGDQGIYSLNDFLHAYTVQEELFVTLIEELAGEADTETQMRTMGDLMVGVMVRNGLTDWDGVELYTDDDGISVSDAFMKGMLVYYHIESQREENDA